MAIEKNIESSALIPHDPLQLYLAEVRRYPLLTREEELKLAILYQKNGDEGAAFKLVTSNLRLVIKIAMQYRRGFTKILDLIQEGNIGLMRAVQCFDPHRGVKLSSYASYWIKAFIMRFILNNWRLVKVGTTQSQRKLFFNLSKEKERLERMGFEATPKLLAETLNVSEGEVGEMTQRLGKSETSLFAQVGNKPGSFEVIDTIASEDGPLQDELVIEKERQEILRTKLKPFLDDLKERDRKIFKERVLAEEPRTLQDLGDEFGISRERVRQLEENMLRKAKKLFLNELEADFGLV